VSSSTLLEVRDWTVDVPAGDRREAVVRGIDFDLRRGEICCFVGESGSGKTVLWRSLLGISRAGVRVSRGSATLLSDAGDHDLRGGMGAAPRTGWAGYVFQHPLQSLDPFRTVGSQVAESIALARTSVAPDDVHARLAEVRLKDPVSVARLHPHELSGGMAQRVAIAIALAAEPELLVADEPTTGLDWSVRREVVDLLRRLTADHGTTLVVISHDFAVVRRLAHRVIVLYRGERMEDGPRRAFFEPGPGLHPYTIELQSRARALADGRSPPLLMAEEPPADEGCRYSHRCAVLRSDAAPDSLAATCRARTPEDRRPAVDHGVRCVAVESAVMPRRAP
jgi:ABC-type dipeptide/oligopeptide/nickel transport system ATPase component